MAWNASGDERGKSYRVYRELEERYRALQEQLEAKETQVSTLRDAIRGMALELANMGKESTAAEVIAASTGLSTRPPPKASGQHRLTLKELLGGSEEEKGAASERKKASK